jgi:hypothetical protein
MGAVLLAAAPLTLALLCAAPEFASVDPDPTGADMLRFFGNRVLPNEVYLAVLALPDDAPPTVETAAQVEGALREFLRKSGYELATVTARLNGKRIDVVMNEGRLEKVVYRGRFTLKTLRFQLALELPHNVFNRPALERRISELAAELALPNVWFELVPSAEVKHSGPQLEQVPAFRGVELLHAREPFELHLFFAENEWDTGVNADLRTGYIDGLEVGINYQGSDGVLPDDRWRVAASGGAGLRERIGSGAIYPAFSRAFAEGKWFSPPVFHNVRPFLWLQGDLVGRQRKDQLLEDYFLANAAASLHLELEATEGLRLSLGGGWEWRRFFSPSPSSGDVTVVRTILDEDGVDRMRAFVLAGVDLVLDSGATRWDRRHALNVEARQYLGLSDPEYTQAAFRYQKVTAFGWHDLWVRARGKLLRGKGVSFYNEEPVGEYLHGRLGTEFVDKIANLNLEFRFSVTRDLFKVSVFHDLAVFGELNRDTVPAKERVRVADSFGLGLHTLIEGILQLDIYVAFGFRTGGQITPPVASALLLKVF